MLKIGRKNQKVLISFDHTKIAELRKNRLKKLRNE